MSCHICGDEAVGRCYTCGQLFCDKHGETDCQSCAAGIAEGDPSPERVTVRRRRSRAEPANAWWRPQEAEDYEPPSCYACKGLTRAVCEGCGRHFCPEHAGRADRCQECHQSAQTGLWALAFLFVVVVGLAFWSFLQRPAPP